MKRLGLLLLTLLLLLPLKVSADATIPTGDIKGSADNPLVGRFEHSFIISYSQKNFDELTLPLSQLVPVEGKKDSHNNHLYRPEKSIDLEGRRTRIIYLNPEGVSSLEVLRNYEQELKEKGGQEMFSCKKGECGGSDTRSSSGGGGEMSLAMYLQPEENIKEKPFSNGHCAQTQWISDQRYMVMELPEHNSFVSVHTYLLQDDNFCKAFNDRTIAVVDIMEVQQMESKMVVLKAEEMAEAITAGGSVALYGIFFDFNKAEIKPESSETLEQIARLLTDRGGLKLLVVGHTDNKGSYGTNLDLSMKRAQAVADALSSEYKVDASRLKPVGVSFACPVSTNATDAGRAKNRRVELVEW